MICILNRNDENTSCFQTIKEKRVLVGVAVAVAVVVIVLVIVLPVVLTRKSNATGKKMFIIS